MNKPTVPIQEAMHRTTAKIIKSGFSAQVHLPIAIARVDDAVSRIE